jgi:hypothetical protein
MDGDRRIHTRIPHQPRTGNEPRLPSTRLLSRIIVVEKQIEPIDRCAQLLFEGRARVPSERPAMMNIDTEREAFEHWGAQNGYRFHLRMNEGEYTTIATQCAWDGWTARSYMASRASAMRALGSPPTVELRAPPRPRGLNASGVAPRLPMLYGLETTHEETSVNDERDLEQLAAGGQAFLMMILAVAALAFALAVSIGGYLYQHHSNFGLLLLTCLCLWAVWKTLPHVLEASLASQNSSGSSVKP